MPVQIMHVKFLSGSGSGSPLLHTSKGPKERGAIAFLDMWRCGDCMGLSLTFEYKCEF